MKNNNIEGINPFKRRTKRRTVRCLNCRKLKIKVRQVVIFDWTVINTLEMNILTSLSATKDDQHVSIVLIGIENVYILM